MASADGSGTDTGTGADADVGADSSADAARSGLLISLAGGLGTTGWRACTNAGTVGLGNAKHITDHTTIRQQVNFLM
ncbi:hypothetical protein PAENIP36_69630 [Paenibacillus sp. P36]